MMQVIVQSIDNFTRFVAKDYNTVIMHYSLSLSVCVCVCVSL